LVIFLLYKKKVTSGIPKGGDTPLGGKGFGLIANNKCVYTHLSLRLLLRKIHLPRQREAIKASPKNEVFMRGSCHVVTDEV